MNSQSPTPPNDNPNLNKDGQPIPPNMSQTDNVIDTTEEGLFDFDLQDLESLFNANTASPAQPSASIPPVDTTDQPLPALDLSTSRLDNHAVAHEPMTVFDTPDSDSTPPDLVKAEAVTLGTMAAANVAAHTASTTPASTSITENNNPTPAEPVTLVKNTPTGTSIGGAGNNSTPPPHLIAPKKPNKNNKPLLILLGLLGIGALAWLASQILAEPEPVSAQKPVPASKAVSVTASSIPASTVTATSGTVATSAPTAPSTATSSPLATKTIKPEEILATPLPKDNAVAKEEIDRLADQSKQLSQQEKMMEEQLKMMNELSSKKEERIALLEKQIAQIEAQKGQAKK